MLVGLPPFYKPVVMALGSSGKDITADLVKMKLLEESENASNGSEFQSEALPAQTLPAQFSARRSSQRGRHRRSAPGRGRYANVRCYNCNRNGNFANQCYAPAASTPRSEDINVCTAATADESEAEDTVCALLASMSPRRTHAVDGDTVYISSVQQIPTVGNAHLAVDSGKGANSNDWIIDSGASTHMCSSKQHMMNIISSKIKSVTAANKSKVPVLGEGEVMLQNRGSKGSSKVLLQKVLHVP